MSRLPIKPDELAKPLGNFDDADRSRILGVPMPLADSTVMAAF
jgi:hypothetical protein